MTFTQDEIEIMAQMEYERWIAEQLLDGWKRGTQKDVTRKTSPYLVPWSELPDDAREQDRQIVRQIPELLAKVGLEIDRQVWGQQGE